MIYVCDIVFHEKSKLHEKKNMIARYEGRHSMQGSVLVVHWGRINFKINNYIRFSMLPANLPLYDDFKCEGRPSKLGSVFGVH